MNVTKGERARFRRHRDDHPATIQNQHPPVTTRSRQEHLARDAHDSSEEDAQEPAPNESVWFDGPLALTLLPPLGSFLTGGDFVRDGLTLALLFYYLRALIKTPWELYLKARAHRSPAFDFESEENIPEEPEQAANLRALARSELRLAELSFLVLCLLTPFLGTILLRYAAFLIGSEKSLTWFSEGLFVLATGIRPWRHLVNLLAYRTDSLHRIVHAPPPPSVALSSSSNARFDRLERSLEEIHASKPSHNAEFQALVERVEASIQKLEIQTTASSHATELVRLDLDSRFHDVQTSVEALVHDIGTLEQRVQAATAAAASANDKLATITDPKQHSAVWHARLSPLAPSGTLADDPRDWAKPLSDHTSSRPLRRHKSSPSQDAATFVLENMQNGGWPQFQERIVHLVVGAVLLPVKLSQRLLHAVLGLLGGAGSPPQTKGVKMVTAPTPSAKT